MVIWSVCSPGMLLFTAGCLQYTPFQQIYLHYCTFTSTNSSPHHKIPIYSSPDFQSSVPLSSKEFHFLFYLTQWNLTIAEKVMDWNFCSHVPFITAVWDPLGGTFFSTTCFRNVQVHFRRDFTVRKNYLNVLDLW